jgi:hypothetical protein
LIDILARAKSIWKLENGVPTARNASNAIIYGKDALNPITINEWVELLSKEAPHLFEGTGGGGASGNRDDSDFGMEGKDWKGIPPEERLSQLRKAGLTSDKGQKRAAQNRV